MPLEFTNSAVPLFKVSSKGLCAEYYWLHSQERHTMGKENEDAVKKHHPDFPLMLHIWTETRRKISSPTPSLLCWFKSIAYLCTFWVCLLMHQPPYAALKRFTCSKSARYNWGNDSQKSVPRPVRSHGFTQPLPVAAVQMHNVGFIGKSVHVDSGEFKKQIRVGAVAAVAQRG